MSETAVAGKVYSIEEYFELEAQVPEKFEFDNGNIRPMAGAIVPHNIVKSAILGLLEKYFIDQNLPFWALNSDTKVRLEGLNKFYYPDVTVVGETPEYYLAPSGKIRRDTVTNPILLVEVLSDDTREFDKTDKFDHYLTIPSFREYLLVEPEKIWVRRILVQDATKGLWEVQTETDLNKAVYLHSISMALSLSDIYKRVSMLPK